MPSQVITRRRASSIDEVVDIMTALERELSRSDGLWWFNNLCAPLWPARHCVRRRLTRLGVLRGWRECHGFGRTARRSRRNAAIAW